MRLIRFMGWIAIAALLIGCGSGSSREVPGNPEDPFAVDAPGIPPGKPSPVEPGLIEFPGDPSGPFPAVKIESDSSYVVLGKDSYSTSATGTQINGDGLALQPEAGAAAWAMYTVPNLTGDRPVTLEVASEDIESAHSYYVGLANYTVYHWEWHGPYSQPVSLVLNSQLIRDRYVSASGTLACAVVVDTGSGGPPVGVMVNSVTATTSPDYLPNNPHYTPIESVTAGDGKAVSELHESQYVTIRWRHIPAFGPGDIQNEAYIYQVFRKGPGDAASVMIGAVLAPETVYVDPVDNASEIPAPVPGYTYTYAVRALNLTNGYTPHSSPKRHTVLFLRPDDLRAKQYEYTSDVDLTWEATFSATGYKVYRDGMEEENVVATLGDVQAWRDEDNESLTATYWVRGFNDLAESEFSYPALFMPFQDYPVVPPPNWPGLAALVAQNEKVFVFHGVNNNDIHLTAIAGLNSGGDIATSTYMVRSEEEPEIASAVMVNGNPMLFFFEEGRKAIWCTAADTPDPGPSDWVTHKLADLGDFEFEERSLAEIDGRAAMTYTNLHDLGIRYMQALVPFPTSAADWATHTIIDNASYSSLVEIDGAPVCSFYDRNDYTIKVAVARSAQPQSAADWDVHTVYSNPESVGWDGSTHIAKVNGRPALGFSVCVDTPTALHSAFYAFSDIAVPTSAVDWQVHLLYSIEHVITKFDIVDFNGRPVMLVDDNWVHSKASLWQSSDSFPASREDWAVAYDVCGNNPWIGYVNGLPLVSPVVDGSIGYVAFLPHTHNQGEGGDI